MPDAFYILTKGTVVVEMDGKVVTSLEGFNPNDKTNSYPFFGEMSLLTHALVRRRGLIPRLDW